MGMYPGFGFRLVLLAAVCVAFSAAADTTPPTVQAVVGTPPLLTNAPTVSYTVTFSEAVTGVDTSDFSLLTSGSLAGTAITDATGSGTTYTVTANTGTGDGQLQLLVLDDDSIVDVDDTPLGGPGVANGTFIGAVFQLDRTAPIVSAIELATPNPALGSTAQFFLNFSEPVSDADNFDVIVESTGLDGAGLSDISRTGPASFTVTANTGYGTGTMRLLVADDNSILDNAGNPLGGPNEGDGNFLLGPTFTVIRDVPPYLATLERAGADPTSDAVVSYNLTFTLPVTGVDPTDFTFDTQGDITGVHIASIDGSGTDYTVNIDVGTGDGLLRLNLVDDDSIVNENGTPLADYGTGFVYNFGEFYTVDRTPPALQLTSLAGDPVCEGLISVTVISAENVTGFTQEDLEVVNATVSGFNGSGNAYAFSLTPLDNGPVSVQVKAGAVFDIVGQTNVASGQLTRQYYLQGSADPEPEGEPSAPITVNFAAAYTTLQTLASNTNGDIDGDSVCDYAELECIAAELAKAGNGALVQTYERNLAQMTTDLGTEVLANAPGLDALFAAWVTEGRYAFVSAIMASPGCTGCNATPNLNAYDFGQVCRLRDAVVACGVVSPPNCPAPPTGEGEGEGEGATEGEGEGEGEGEPPVVTCLTAEEVTAQGQLFFTTIGLPIAAWDLDITQNQMPDSWDAALANEFLCGAPLFPGLVLDETLRASAIADYTANITQFRQETAYGLLLKDIEEVMSMLIMQNQQAFDIYGVTVGLQAGTYAPFSFGGQDPFSADGDLDGDGATNFEEYRFTVLAGGGLNDYLRAALDPTIVPPAGEGEGEGEGEGAAEGEGEGEGEGQGTTQSADTDNDGKISLSELLRVIQFYNVGAYHCGFGTEDGFEPGAGDQNCAPHNTDYNPQDWVISLSELLRAIQFFNSTGYTLCVGSEDGFCPNV